MGPGHEERWARLWARAARRGTPGSALPAAARLEAAQRLTPGSGAPAARPANAGLALLPPGFADLPVAAPRPAEPAPRPPPRPPAAPAPVAPPAVRPSGRVELGDPRRR